MMKQTAWKWIDDNSDLITNVTDKLWGFAEYGLLEEKSSKLIAETLDDNDFDVKLGVAGMPTAIHAEWGSGKPIIGVMGEYDALPGLSNKVVPYKEPLVEGGMGHGCGHHIHGVSGMSTAIAVRHSMEKHGLEGIIRFYGCPAEENFQGKIFMVREGLFDDVDACLSHHPGAYNTARLSSSNATIHAKFNFYGKTSHAASSPEQGRSALDAVELMNVGVNFLREHIIDKARIHYVIESGGGQPNVVPDFANSWYYVRAPEIDQVENIYKRVEKIAEGASLMTETDVKIEMDRGSYNKIPNRVLSELVVANMREVGPPKYTEEELKFAAEISKSFPKELKIDTLKKSKIPNWEKYVDVDLFNDILDAWDEGEVSPGSTDVSHVSWVVPTMEFGTACNVLGAPGHSWQFVAINGSTVGHKSVIFAAKTMAGSVLELMTKPRLLAKAKEEHKKRLAGKIYKPIDPDRKPPLELARETAEQLKSKV
jgi:aminobenzoyl-glutamate utilization protein B